MVKQDFRERLAEGPILADGAMGTMLNQWGVSLNANLDIKNLSDPGLVEKVHRAYLEAGAEIIETNTFSANSLKLQASKLQMQTVEINEAAVEIARRAVEASGRESVYIAGSVGPLGGYIEPFGRIRQRTATEAFRKQIATLIHAGVDLLVFETFTNVDELILAIDVARSIRDSIPIVASMTFTRDSQTLMGDSPQYVAEALAEKEVDVIGINCSSGPAQIRRILHRMRHEVPHTRFSVMPNAGWPEMSGGRVLYPANPDYFGQYARIFTMEGATIIGGCCGTTPDHIQVMREALDNPKPNVRFDSVPLTEETDAFIEIETPPTELEKRLEGGQFVITVEMAPPRGVMVQKVVAAADMLRTAGVTTVNVSDSPMARMRMSPWAMAHLIQDRVGIETVLHFPTRGRNILRVQGDLLAAHALNVRNIFVVMGDPTHIGDYPDASNTHDIVPSGLLRLIKKKLNAGMDEAGNSIAQATSFYAGTALNLNSPNPEKEIKLLRKKIDAGADFALTQPVFDVGIAERFLKRYEDTHGKLTLPVIVGVLPLYNMRHASFLHNEVPGIDIPEHIMNRLSGAEDTSREGVAIASELALELREMVQGIYLMPPFAKYHLAAEIAEVVTQGQSGEVQSQVKYQDNF